MDQLDRESTISDFKKLIKTLMVATSVAGRGLDVPELVCVINYR
jgi:ATP-dependent RNA helicase DDX46/PRP5